MLGNEAIARGLVESGCVLATSYPGTPASEILGALAAFQKQTGVTMHIQWAVNEKVAFEIAYAGSMSGLRAAVSMKQVGLNVASDPLMSAAYMGTKGGFIIVSADDPGPHSSQTEQDSRLMAMMAKIPVLDPRSPVQAKELIAVAYDLSETYRIPVMLRPTTRVCHARQDVEVKSVKPFNRAVEFKKDPARWAATPKFRFILHQELEDKLEQIAADDRTAPRLLNPETQAIKAVVTSGVAAAHALEIIQASQLGGDLALYQVLQPFPLHHAFINELRAKYEEILVIEETMGVIEMQLADRTRVKGKLTKDVSRVGELLPETIAGLLHRFAGRPVDVGDIPAVPGRRPTLCAGCPHRASFFAIKKAAPKAIYTSDIGCYTLGLNLGAVDTVLCMGAAISQAAGFYHAHKNEARPPKIIATIGDSTFFHAGLPALIDAVVQKVRFVLVILDNRTTAMTGNQPTPATGTGVAGETLQTVDIEAVVKGCGVRSVRSGDPYQLEDFTALVKAAVTDSQAGPSVVIARHPCLLDRRQPTPSHTVKAIEISDTCDGCGFCVKHFECPALVMQQEGEEERVTIDPVLCSGCGVCIAVCPKKSIQECQA